MGGGGGEGLADTLQCPQGLPGPREGLVMEGGVLADIFQCPLRLQGPQDLLLVPGAPAGPGAPGTMRRSCGRGGGVLADILQCPQGLPGQQKDLVVGGRGASRHISLPSEAPGTTIRSSSESDRQHSCMIHGDQEIHNVVSLKSSQQGGWE